VLILKPVAKNKAGKNGFVMGTNFAVLAELSVMGCPKIGLNLIYGNSVKITYLTSRERAYQMS
jgi:hypothetical protein